MKSFFQRALVVLVIFLSGFADAETYIEAFQVNYDNFPGYNAYLEQTVSDNDSVFINLYSDAWYEAGYIGLARSFGDIQLGLGVGEARYYDADDRQVTSFAYNPWWWYQDDYGIESYGEVEYLRDDSKLYYYRAYIQKDIWMNVFAGVYTERTVGTGLMLGIKFESDNMGLQLYAVKPHFNVTSVVEDQTDLVAYATVWLAF